ncbi:MAG: Gmad2 immunoglobulin-like domain-containing protein [Patescibacteria group bacterium]
MKKSYFLLIVVGLILFSALIIRISGFGVIAPVTDNNKKDINIVGNDRDEHGCIASAGYIWCEAKQKCLRSWEETCELVEGKDKLATEDLQASFSKDALVSTPKQNEVISSPLKVEGSVVGNWFFEGSLPVKLVDFQNNVISSSQARSEGDWMTEKPVRFSANLEFTTTATSGYLIIFKDNPSGLPENDGEIRVPIKFK